MSVSVQQVLSNARELVTRLKEYDNNTDNLMAQTNNLSKCVEAMRQYHEEMNVLSSLSSQPRSSIIVTIQRESKQLRKLENENRDLKCAVEDYQFVLELIMSKYRQHTTKLIKVKNDEIGCANVERDNSQQMIHKLINDICDMAAVMNKSIEIDENNGQREQQLLAQLKLENQGLRQLLQIAKTNGSVASVPPTQEVNTDAN